ncbi:MAG TPA: divalent-cation tolerance protein CutA [Novosphingobium sp.]|nr:divalent-cation tolerance protein CutA [Novosphingobium sp.]HQN54656.1 divalent-cation tolerance protein CutA [Novosphingobium sp.]
MVWCPFPDAQSARAVAGTMLDEGLVACANILGSMLSLFTWNGERGEAEETGVLFKTDAALFERVVVRLAELHPYESPAILAWRCDAAHPATAAWLAGLGA